MSDTPRVDFVATADPLLRDVPLPFSEEWAVLGVRTRVETNSRLVLGVARHAFDDWRGVAAEDGRGVRVRVVVHEGSEHVAGRAPVRHVAPDASRLIVHSPGSVAVADPERGEAAAYVTTALAADRDHFRATVLEAVTYALLSHRDRHPVHAAAVACDGRAVLLAGPSGAGKSTLAHLAAGEGIDVLGEDRVWVELDRALRVWGSARRVRLRDGGGGKEEVPIHAPGRHAVPASVCVLARGGESSLERVAPGEIAGALGARVDPGFDRFPARHARVVRALAADGGWRLTLTGDPRDALPHLHRMLGAR